MVVSPALWTALITPLRQDGKVDYRSLAKLLAAQKEAGNGVLLFGSTGEGLNLSFGERLEVVAFATDQKAGVPLMVNLGGFDQSAVLDWIERLEELPVDAYLAATPPYAKPGPEGQRHWFKSLLDASSRPLMLYNIPGRSGVELSGEALQRLRDHPRLWAIKEASGSVESFAGYRECAPKVEFYSGDDPLLPDFVPMGAKGLVSVASNVWPAATRRYVEKALAGELLEDEKKALERGDFRLVFGGQSGHRQALDERDRSHRKSRLPPSPSPTWKKSIWRACWRPTKR